eukprot:scaffold2200_cov112-Cylindrotheca_fusiformis.AAC.3
MAATFSARSVVAQEDVCNFDGEVFRRGESVGSNFETRCGPWEDWPCYCNPDVPYQVDCPYCGFATNTENLVRCARNGESVKLIDVSDGRGKRCTCDASNPSWPKGSCVDDGTAEYCQFDIEGQSYWYAPGEEVDVLDPCGSQTEYPCYCNPNMQEQLECPYCTVATSGDTIECMKDQEVKKLNIFETEEQSCVCNYAMRTNLNFPALPTCNTDNGCVVQENNGAVAFYNDGDVVLRKEGICGNGFPYICDTSGIYAATNNLKYPYCDFEDQNGAIRCAQDGEEITLIDPNGLSANCSCQIGLRGVQKQCRSILEQTSPPTVPNAPAPSVSIKGSSAEKVVPASLHLITMASAFCLFPV